MKTPRWLFAITLVYGVMTFLWLSSEDTGWSVVLFGAGLSILFALYAGIRFKGRTVPAWQRTGGLTGAGSAAATILLMLLKIFLHDDPYLAYPVPLMVGIAARLPIWAAAGALVGLALAIQNYRADD